MARHILLYLSLFSLVFTAEAHIFRNYQMEDGLSQNSVWSVIQDKRGFMWFGTRDGLNRFDGKTFKTYRKQHGDTLSLGNNFVRALKEDTKGRLLVGTEQGLYLFDRDRESFFRIYLEKDREKEPNVVISDIMEDMSGNIWVACYGQGIFVLDADLNVKKHYQKRESSSNSLPTNYIWTIRQNGNGVIWIGTIGEGLIRLDTEDERFTNLFADKTYGIDDNVIYSLYSDRDQNLWIGTSTSGLYCYNYRTGKVACYTTDNDREEILNIKTIVPFSKNKLLLGADNGLILFDMDKGDFEIMPNSVSTDQSSEKSVFSITQDNEGAFWIGTYFRGVDYYSPVINHFTYFHSGHKNTLSGRIVSSFAEAGNGDIWIGTNDGGLTLFKPRTSAFENSYRNSLSYHNIQTLLPDGEKLWIGLYSKGVDVLNMKSNRVVNYSTRSFQSNGLSDNNIYSFYKTSEGLLLIGNPIGVDCFNPSDNSFDKIACLDGVYVKDIIEDDKGSIWFATNGSGLYRLFPDGKSEIFTYNPQDSTSLSSNYINCIYQDIKRRMWIGTEGGGLALFDPKTNTFKIINEKQGLPNNVVYAILDDVDGNIWVSTNSGLARINPETLSIKTFGYVDDLLKIRYNYNCALRTSDNKFYFGGTDGFIVFDPTEITDNQIVPNVIISGFQLFNKDVLLDTKSSPLKSAIYDTEEITLAHNQSTFSFDFVALSYFSPRQNEYAYKLEGFDREWNYVNNNNKAYYTNIPPGKYTFRVKAANNDGVWSTEDTAISIRIKRPFWFSSFMIVIYGLLITAIVWYIVHKQKERLERENQEKIYKYKIAKEKETYESKINFFTNIAHEIRTPLSLITGPLENIILSNDGTPQTKTGLELIERNANRLLELVNQLLDFRKIEDAKFHLEFLNYDVVEIIRKIFNQYDYNAELKNIDMELVTQQEEIICLCDAEAIRKIISNLLANAIKYARKTILIKVDSMDNNLHVSIEDDGMGFSNEFIDKIFEPFYQIDNEDNTTKVGSGLGLTIAQSLAQEHGGEILIQSEQGKGSVFTLKMPIVIAPEETAKTDRTINKPVITSPPVTVELDLSILIVEDNAELCEFISHSLGSRFSIYKAANGVEALEIVEKENIDIIISDILMPKMGGLELCRILKSDPAYSHIPLILLSAKTDTDTKVEGFESGADIYVEKPFSMEQLKAQTNSILENRNRIRENFLKSPLLYFKQNPEKGEKAEFVEKINEIIHEHLSDGSFSIDRLSEEFSMSRSNFHKKIKNITGVTPNDYIKLIRLNKAAQMLSTGKYKISEVCYLVGFNTPSYFSKCFYEHFGKLPKDFVNIEDKEPIS